MKFTRALLVVSLVAGSVLTQARAEPRGGSFNNRDFLDGSSDRAGWNAGIFVQQRDRAVLIENVSGTIDPLDVAVYVGHPILPWIVLYGVAGQKTASFDAFGLGNTERGFLYGAGTHLDLFAHEIQDPLLMENQIRVNADVMYSNARIDALGDGQNFSEFQGSLTVSIVNELTGNKLFVPESIALFAGPAFSSLGGDLEGDGEETVGFTAGMEVFHTQQVSYYARLDEFSSTGYAAGLNVRF